MPSAPKEDADALRNGFSKKKIPEDIDHIIVGSGLSGLYLAAMLSKIGRKVLVLEQHYVVGGCTHIFKDKGFEFDTGVHYTGSATQLTALMDFAAGQQGAFKQERQGSDDGSEVYNEFHAGGKCVHRFRPGPKTFVKDLVEKWPQEELAIHRFFRAVNVAAPSMAIIAVKYFMPTALWVFLPEDAWASEMGCRSLLQEHRRSGAGQVWSEGWDVARHALCGVRRLWYNSR